MKLMFAVVFLAMTLTACGSSSPTAVASRSGEPTTAAAPTQSSSSTPPASASASVTSAAAGLDPCALVTKGEVATIFGGTSAAGYGQAAADPELGPQCGFAVTGSPLAATMTVVDRLPQISPHDFRSDAVGYQAISGVGDSAYYVPDGALTFLKGQHVVGVQLFGDIEGSETAQLTDLTALAKIIAQRI